MGFSYFIFPECVRRNGWEASPRLSLIFIATLCYMGQQHLLCNLLVPVSSAVPCRQDMQSFCTSEVGLGSWFQMLVLKGPNTLKTP